MSNRSTLFRLGLVASASIASIAPAHANPDHGAPAAGTMVQSQYASAPLEYRSDTVRHGSYDNAAHSTYATGHTRGVETVTHYSTTTEHAGAYQDHYTDNGYVHSEIYPAHQQTYPAHQQTYPAHHSVGNPAHVPQHLSVRGPVHGGPIHGGFDRDQWLAECRRRTDTVRDDDEKGGIIGGLLGAITGGIVGNRVYDEERLAGTLIGAGVGGLAGLVIGTLIQRGGKDRDRGYDCEAALDNYLSHYGYGHGYGGHGGGYQGGYTHGSYGHGSYGYAGTGQYGSYGHYSYAGGYYPGCGCQPHITYIPIHYQQRQRVVVRETVTEEIIPGKVRHIPGKYIKETRQVVVPVKHTRPAPVKIIKR